MFVSDAYQALTNAYLIASGACVAPTAAQLGGTCACSRRVAADVLSVYFLPTPVSA